MITRFVFGKLNDPADREVVVAAARLAFARIPVVRAFEVMVPADADAEVWDVCFLLRFDTLADVQTYLDHPAHVTFVEEAFKPRTAVKKGWNFA